MLRKKYISYKGDAIYYGDPFLYQALCTLLSNRNYARKYFTFFSRSHLSQGVSDHCHYQGSIRGLKDSTVVLNTCSGLRYSY